MSKAEDLLVKLVDFVATEFCETDSQDCDCCTHFDQGNCPVVLAKQYLIDEGLYDE